MKNFSLFYALTRLFVLPALRMYYRVEKRNYGYFPDQGPVLVCSNHVNAFMDPVMLQANSHRQLYSLARGDAFDHLLLRKLLTAWKMIPIFRQSEGASNLIRNELTFSISAAVLSKGNSLIIYPESVCVQERRVRKLKKGAARIAFQTEEATDFKSGLVLLPLGLTYQNPQQFGSRLMMNFGEPLAVSNYAALYREDRAKALLSITNDLELAMKKLTINIEHRENDGFVEQVFKLLNRAGDYDCSLELTEKINTLTGRDQVEAEALRVQTNSYFESLKERTLEDRFLEADSLKRGSGIQPLVDLFLLVLGMPLYTAGLLTSYPGYSMGHLAERKIARNLEFRASVKMTAGWFAWVGYYLLQLLVVALVFRNWTLLGCYGFTVVVLMYFSLAYNRFLKDYRGRCKAARLNSRSPGEFGRLLGERKVLLDLLKRELR